MYILDYKASQLKFKKNAQYTNLMIKIKLSQKTVMS